MNKGYKTNTHTHTHTHTYTHTHTHTHTIYCTEVVNIPTRSLTTILEILIFFIYFCFLITILFLLWPSVHLRNLMILSWYCHSLLTFHQLKWRCSFSLLNSWLFLCWLRCSLWLFNSCFTEKLSLIWLFVKLFSNCASWSRL